MGSKKWLPGGRKRGTPSTPERVARARFARESLLRRQRRPLAGPAGSRGIVRAMVEIAVAFGATDELDAEFIDLLAGEE